MLRIKTHTYINTQKNCFSLSPSKYRRIRNYSIFSVNGFPSMSNSIEHFKIIWKTNNKKRNNFQTKNQKKNHKTAKNTSKKFKNKMNTKKCVNDLKISNKKRKLKSREKNYEKTDWALFNLTTIQYEFIFRNPWNFRTNSDRFHFHLIGFAFDWNCHYLSLVMQYFFLRYTLRIVSRCTRVCILHFESASSLNHYYDHIQFAYNYCSIFFSRTNQFRSAFFFDLQYKFSLR